MRMFHFFLVLLLAGCSTASSLSGKPLPDITFQHIEPLQLSVAEIVVEDRAPEKTLSERSYFTVPYRTVLQDYVNQKFQALGGDSVLNIAVDEISVTEEFEKSANRVASFLGVAGVEVYHVALALNVSVRAIDGSVQGVRLNASRKIKVTEHASIAERERRQFEGLEAMFRELDSSVTRVVLGDLSVRGHLGDRSAASVSSFDLPSGDVPIEASTAGDSAPISVWEPVPLYNQGQERDDSSGSKNAVIERQAL